MIKAIIEMPKGTRYKLELKDGVLVLDRPVKEPVPHNYGYIPGTLCGDGDPADVFIASLESIPPQTQVELDVIGVIHCEDDKGGDPKYLAYVKDDELSKKQVNLTEFVNECLFYLRNYKEGVKIGKVVLGEVNPYDEKG